MKISELNKNRQELIDNQGNSLQSHVETMEERLSLLLKAAGDITNEARALFLEVGELKNRGAMLSDTAYGIEIDEDFTSITTRGLKEIGILAAESEDAPGSLSLSVLDALLAYSRGLTETLLEVPYKVNLNPKDLLIMAQNCGFNISLLPPSESSNPTQEDWAGYTARVCDFAREWVQQKNQDQNVFPVASYLQYLVMEEFDNPPDQIATDDYIISNFINPIPSDQMDSIKAALKQAIFDAFGGDAEFRAFCHSLAHAVAKTIAEIPAKQ